MVKEWSKVLMSLLLLPALATFVEVVSTVAAVVMAIAFPLLLITIFTYLEGGITSDLTFDIPKTAFVGESVTAKARLSVRSGFGLVMVHLPTAERFEMTEGTNVHVLFKGLRPAEREYSYTLRALRRGRFDFKRMELTYYASTGLFTRRMITTDSGCVVDVLPRVKVVRRVRLNIAANKLVPRSARSRLGPYSTDFVSVREYVPGDPYKFINWKASARSTSAPSLMANDYVREGLRTVVFIVDRSSAMSVGTREDNPLEYGVSLALSYSKLLLNYGSNVGLWLSPPPGVGYGFLIPSSGFEHFHRLKEVLLTVEPQGETEESKTSPSLEKLFTRIVVESRPDVIILTNVVTPSVSNLKRTIRRVRDAGGRVTVVDIVPFSIQERFKSSVFGPPAGQLVYLSKRRTDKHLLGRGVRFVAWDPVQEGVGTVVARLARVANT